MVVNDIDPEKVLTYFFSRKDIYLVISFCGPFLKINEPVIEECRTAVVDILQNEVRCVVINMHDVHEVALNCIAPLVRLQMAIRQQRTLLRLCFLETTIERILKDQGAIRAEELSSDLVSALMSCRDAVGATIIKK